MQHLTSLPLSHLHELGHEPQLAVPQTGAVELHDVAVARDEFEDGNLMHEAFAGLAVGLHHHFDGYRLHLCAHALVDVAEGAMAELMILTVIRFANAAEMRLLSELGGHWHAGNIWLVRESIMQAGISNQIDVGHEAGSA